MTGRRLGAAAALLLVSGGCSKGGGTDQPEVVVFAAASMVTALDGIVAAYETEYDADVVVNYAASATLAQQILAGARADVFLSADTAWADRLGESVPVSRREEAFGNSLVLVVPSGRDADSVPLDDLLTGRFKSIAIGEPGSVPAGKYAREAFQNTGLWEAIRGKCVMTLDVRQALLYAERGEVDAAVVYATDAVGGAVEIVAILDEYLSAPVRYSFVLLDSTPENSGSTTFFEFLLSSDAAALFSSAGFELLAQPAHN